MKIKDAIGIAKAQGRFIDTLKVWEELEDVNDIPRRFVYKLVTWSTILVNAQEARIKELEEEVARLKGMAI